MAPADWHVASVRIPFHTAAHADVARRALGVDQEQNGGLVERALEVEGDELVVTYRAATVRLLRLATNTLLSSAELVVRAMADFAPDPAAPAVSDAELQAARGAGAGVGARGIELRDGRGAGGGDEVA